MNPTDSCIQVPSPAPSDGSLPLPFAAGYSTLVCSRPSSTQISGSQSIGSYEWQMPWTLSTSADSSWSHASGGNSVVPSAQYHHLVAQVNESQRENTSLLTKNAALEAKYETLMLAYNMLLTHIPATSTLNRAVALHQQDYPNVRFWTRQDWNSFTQEQPLEVDQPEEGEVFPELDEEDGPKEPPPITWTSLHAWSLWVQMALAEKLPRTWSNADAASLATYNESMAQHFVELRLCAADWKANLIATDNYPSWCHNWVKKKNKEGSASKHPTDSRLDTNVPATKKVKVLLESDDQLLPQLPPSIPETRPESFNVIPTISVISGTPSKPQPAPVLVPPQTHITNQQGELDVSLLRPTPQNNFNFTIGNPLAFNCNAPLTNITALHAPAAPIPNQFPVLSTEVTNALTSAAANLPGTSALPSLATANDGAKCLKGTCMQPTKTTTARNLCAQEWVKNNSQGTTDEFKIYYNNLSEEEKQVWEDKSKAAA